MKPDPVAKARGEAAQALAVLLLDSDTRLGALPSCQVHAVLHEDSVRFELDAQPSFSIIGSFVPIEGLQGGLHSCALTIAGKDAIDLSDLLETLRIVQHVNREDAEIVSKLEYASLLIQLRVALACLH